MVLCGGQNVRVACASRSPCTHQYNTAAMDTEFVVEDVEAIIKTVSSPALVTTI